MVNATIYIGGRAADSLELRLSLNTDVEDVSRFIERGAGVYSLSFVLPFTKTNNDIFASLYNLTTFANVTANEAVYMSNYLKTNFNRNYRTPAVISAPGVNTEGFIVLEQISRDGYQIQFIGGGFGWLGDTEKKLAELDLGPDFCYNKDNVTGSWTGNGDSNVYVFPLIDYGNLSDVEFNNTNTDVTDLLPAVFAKKLLTTFFGSLGYQMRSRWFDEANNRDLIIPFCLDALVPVNKTLLVDTDVLNVSEAGTQTINGGNAFVVSLYANTINYDPDGRWQVSTTANKDTFQGGPNGLCVSGLTRRYIAYITGDVFNSFGQNTLKLRTQVTTPVPVTAFTQNFSAPPGSSSFSYIHEFDLADGKQMYIEACGVLGSLDISNLNIIIAALPYSGEGMTINMAENVPDITCMDLLRALIAAFNLYIYTDEAAKIVYIEPEADFFTRPYTQVLDKITDWTRKIDHGRDSEIIFANDQYARKVWLGWDSGNDFLNDQYQSANRDKTFGAYGWDNNNQTTDPEQDITVNGFVPTFGSYRITGPMPDHYIPRIWVDDYRNPDVNTDFEFQTGTDVRFLIYRYLNDSYRPLWNLDYANASAVYTTNERPMAFFDLPNAPIGIDIPSGGTDTLSFADTDKTGLYSRYYADKFDKIKTGRIMTCYVLLNDAEFFNLDIRRAVRIDNKYWRIIKVESFIPGGAEATRITLYEL